jgi:hypothetical protein
MTEILKRRKIKQTDKQTNKLNFKHSYLVEHYDLLLSIDIKRKNRKRAIGTKCLISNENKNIYKKIM